MTYQFKDEDSFAVIFIFLLVIVVEIYKNTHLFSSTYAKFTCFTNNDNFID